MKSSRKQRILRYARNANEQATVESRVNRRLKGFGSHVASPIVWARAMDLHDTGVLRISPKKFAWKVQRLIDAPPKEKLQEFHMTENPEIRHLILKVLSIFPKYSNWVKELKNEEFRKKK